MNSYQKWESAVLSPGAELEHECHEDLNLTISWACAKCGRRVKVKGFTIDSDYPRWWLRGCYSMCHNGEGFVCKCCRKAMQ